MIRNDEFWRAITLIAGEVLAQAEEKGHGMTSLDIKFADGKPVVVTRSLSEARRFKSNEESLADIAKLIESDITTGYTGTRTFTTIMDKGKIARLLIDDFRSIPL